jgi:hypothetical protein
MSGQAILCTGQGVKLYGTRPERVLPASTDVFQNILLAFSSKTVFTDKIPLLLP